MRPVSSLAQTDLCYGRRGKRFLCVGLLTCAGFASFAAGPVVSNVRVAQRPGTGILDITYDLADPDSDILSVAVNISTNDGVSWFSPVASNLTGAVGLFASSPGVGRNIAWQGWRELPPLLFPGVKAQVIADDTVFPFLVIDLSGGTNAVSYPMTGLDSAPVGGWTDEYKTTKLVMRKFLAGTYEMGSPVGELGHGTNESQHAVTLTNGFYIGMFEVTQRQWELVMGNRPSYFTNAAYYATRPVETVSYYDVRENPTNGAITPNWPASAQVHASSFMGRLRARTGMSMFDLPTEAQWEYACRAGTTTALNSGTNLSSLTSDANMAAVGRYWYNGGYSYSKNGDASSGTAKAGAYLTNSVGLYDAHGNVHEWCLDWYGAYAGAVVNPMGRASGNARIVRGGGWDFNAQGCRSAERDYYAPNTRGAAIGLRVALTLGASAGGASGQFPVTVYDLSPSYMAIGVSVSAVGETGAVQVAGENSGDGGTSVKMGGAGVLADGGMAGIEWSVPGSGVLAFDWQVSSEEGADGLIFYEVGGAITNRISGTGAGWTRVFVSTAGAPDTIHTFRWEYAKDPAGNFAGLDCGWVDAVSWSLFYSLTVNNGDGDGQYTNGAIVTVTADAPPTGERFDYWTGDTKAVLSVTSSPTLVTMPASDISIAATYVNVYTLTVAGGAGGGSYTNGQHVTVTADSPPIGTRFDHWIGATEYVMSVTSATTFVTMPASGISIAAAYVNVFTLTVASGTGSGSYTNGQQVTIVAKAPAVGKAYDCWVGATQYVENVTASTTLVIMPATNISVTATYKDIYYTLTVVNGTGGGSYTNGQQVAVMADAPPLGMQFDRWSGATAYVASLTSPTTLVTMPVSNISIVATYINVYALTVVNGTGSGLYTNGQWVAVSADAPQLGKIFDRWIGATQVLANASSSSTVARMPSSPIAITATYIDAYALTVNAGNGDGLYPEGQRVTITADTPQLGMGFDRWTGDVAAVANVTSSVTTVVMPTSAVTVTATYISYASMLPESRILDFNDYVLTNNAPTPTWVHEGPMPPGFFFIKALLSGTNHYHRTGWKFMSCRTGCSGYMSNARIIPPKSPATTPANPYIASDLAANLRNDLGARIESPVFTNGIGTIYFEAINGVQDYPTQISVDIATNMVSLDLGTIVGTVAPPSTNGLDYVWQPLDVLDLNAATTNDFVRYRKLVNCRDPIKMRMRRTGTVYPEIGSLDNAFTVIDNIRVSLPPSDVVITRPECLFAPGYPCVNAAMTIRCVVSNVDTNAPTDSRSVKVCTRWRYLNQQVGAWMTNSMAYVEGTGDGQGNGEVYQAALPPQGEVGDLEYYFICAFSGVSYVSPDFTGGGYQYASESASPRTLRGTPGEYAVRLRPFASDYGMVYVESDQHAGPIGMALAGDGVWRALVPMGSMGLANLTWRFKAVNAYDPGTASFATNVTYWAGAGQPVMRYTPFDGVCVPDDGQGRLGLKIMSACGYAMLTLDTRTLAYQVRRAEAQDFNAWPARTDVFTASSGQTAKQSFLNSFNSWPTNADTICREPFAAFVSTTNVYMRGPFLTPQMWSAGGAAYVSERPFDKVYAPQGVSNFRNLALRLKGGDSTLDLGYAHNTAATLTDGLKDITFKCRLGQGFGKDDIAYYRNGFTNFNYAVQGFTVVLPYSVSPETPSVSIIGYYQDADHFYEYRVSQIKDPRDTVSLFQDQASRHELFKWVNGVAIRLATADVTSISLTVSTLIQMRFYNTDATHTLIKCKFGTSDRLTYTDSSAPLQYGTIGVLSGESHSVFFEIYTQPTDSSANLTGVPTGVLNSSTSTEFDSQAPAWYAPAGQFQLMELYDPKGIYSVVPVQQLGVYVQDGDRVSGAEPGDSWQLVKQVAVTNFSYQTVTVPINSWHPQFVKLQVMSNACDVVVDEIAVTSRHGQKSGTGDVNPNDWLATEAWVVSNSTDHAQVVQLDHARGDPSVAQGVRSLLLTNGLGVMEFDYRVLRPPAKLIVQYARLVAPDAWSDVRSVSVTNVSDWLHAQVYLGLPEAGYFRLVNDRSGSYTNALVEIDNARVWDEPAVTETSWRVYNAKVTDTDASRVALDGSKACFLNNSTTAEADPVQDLSDPYVQTPVLSAGLGYLSFSARAYATGQVATVYLYASTNGWNASADKWFEVYRFGSITNTLYARYSFEVPAGVDCDAIRLMTHTTGGAARACVEDVVAAEPSAVIADVVSVRASRPQQTITQSGTAVDVTLRLAGRFALRKSVPEADAASGPEVGLIVNGEVAWAPLYALNVTHASEGWRTDAVFRYTVRPGDMAEPLRLVGAGKALDPYSFLWNGWEIYSLDTSSDAVWRFNPMLTTAADAYDPDLTGACVVLKTLVFDAQTPDWVPATAAVTWRCLLYTSDAADE